ncbi:MAG: hypothetical protein ACKVX7_12125 [Planctomycetota bacterium]
MRVRILPIAVGLLNGLLLTALARAEPPLNDDCADAILMTCGSLVTGDTSQASSDTAPFCGTTDGSGGGVWYRFFGNGDEIILTTCTSGTDFDTKLRVYSGTCGAFDCVAGNDDAACSFSGFRSRVIWLSEPGVEYLILLHGFSGATGNFALSLTCSPPPAPAVNDDCANAIEVTDGVYTGNTQANNNDGNSTCGNADSSPSVWYSYTATNDFLLRVETCSDATLYNSVLSIHTGCLGVGANEVACNDNSCGLQSRAEVAMTSGTTYYIRVSGNSGAAGLFTLTVQTTDPTLVVGPDVIFSDCTDIATWGALGGIRAYSLASSTCNIGDEDLQWGGQTPLLGTNAFRMLDGRLEQIGMSWMKNGTSAAAGNGCGLLCNGQGGSVLGAGCRDNNGSAFSGSQSFLGPRSAVNAFTGDYPGPSGSSATLLHKRLQIPEADLLHPDALYFCEGVYVASDDAAAGNAHNNASYKRMTVTTGTFELTPVGAIQTTVPAIYAWADHGLGVDTPDPSVVVTPVDVPGEGRFFVAAKATLLASGEWRYEYAIYNLNSHRSAGSFTIPIDSRAGVAGMGFHDINYHSGEPYDNTDWNATIGVGSVSWSSPQSFAQNPNSNALRFGTLYTFWYDAALPPQSVNATIGLFRPGAPDVITFAVPAPFDVSQSFVRYDCNVDDGFDIADPIAMLGYLFSGSGPSAPLMCLDACDANDDGGLDISDPISMLSALFSGGATIGPYPGCGIDATIDALGCASYSSCP